MKLGVSKILFNRQNKQAILLYMATFLGIGLGVLTSVLNTRSLAPASYGDFKYIQNIIDFFSGFLLFGYLVSGARLLAITKTETDRRGIKGIMVLILIISVFVLMISLVVSFFIHRDFLSNPVAPMFLIAIPVSANTLMKDYINTTAIGENQIGRIALTRILPSVVYIFIAYSIYKHIGATSDRMLLLYNGSAIVIYFVIIISTRPSFKNLRCSFRTLNLENKSYGAQVYMGSIVGVGFSYLAGITLGLYNTDNTDVGFYSLALTLTVPLLMLPKSIGSVYYKKFATANKIPTKVLKYSLILATFGFVGFVLVIFPAVYFLYDDSYSIVAIYASLLAIGSTIHGFGDMLTQFLGSHGQGRQIKFGAYYSGAILLFGYVVLVYFFGIYGAILTKIIGSSVYCGYMFLNYINYTKRLLLTSKNEKEHH